MVKTNEQLTADVKSLTDKYNMIAGLIKELQSDVDGKIKMSDLSRSEQATNDQLVAQAATLDRFEAKLAKIGLPDEPRLYLNESDIKNFQINLSKLLAMMTTFEQLYNNLVAYVANNMPTVS